MSYLFWLSAMSLIIALGVVRKFWMVHHPSRREKTRLHLGWAIDEASGPPAGIIQQYLAVEEMTAGEFVERYEAALDEQDQLRGKATSARRESCGCVYYQLPNNHRVRQFCTDHHRRAQGVEGDAALLEFHARTTKLPTYNPQVSHGLWCQCQNCRDLRKGVSISQRQYSAIMKAYVEAGATPEAIAKQERHLRSTYTISSRVVPSSIDPVTGKPYTP